MTHALWSPTPRRPNWVHRWLSASHAAGASHVVTCSWPVASQRVSTPPGEQLAAPASPQDAPPVPPSLPASIPPVPASVPLSSPWPPVPLVVNVVIPVPPDPPVVVDELCPGPMFKNRVAGRYEQEARPEAPEADKGSLHGRPA